MYNWYTVSTGNLCPNGWHVPTNAEWTTLSDYLGGTLIAGGKLKETRYNYNWINPNTGATNETGFTARPGGYRFISGEFLDKGYTSYWWSSQENSSIMAWYWRLSYSNSTLYLGYTSKGYGHSVRCLKD